MKREDVEKAVEAALFDKLPCPEYRIRNALMTIFDALSAEKAGVESDPGLYARVMELESHHRVYGPGNSGISGSPIRILFRVNNKELSMDKIELARLIREVVADWHCPQEGKVENMVQTAIEEMLGKICERLDQNSKALKWSCCAENNYRGGYVERGW